jgi:predicted aspartyl protease/phage head maturation protease
MSILSIRSIPLIVLAGVLSLTSTGCSEVVSRQEARDEEASQQSVPIPGTQEVRLTSKPASEPASEPVSEPVIDSESAPSNLYRQGIDRASSAFTLSRSAQSQDDWSLVARRWQQAVDLMAAVPALDPNYAQAQSKVAEYRTNLNYAQQQATRSTIASHDNITIRRSQSAPPPPITPAAPPVAAASLPPLTPASPTTGSRDSRAFYAPIVRREGNTPVIQVMFNGNQTFDMIVDTGASGTLITSRMAQALGVVPVGAARVDTASESGVVVPLGYVSSMEVNGAMAQNVLVAIAGAQLGTGLLGHDFFGNFDVTVREHEVVFRERSGV